MSRLLLLFVVLLIPLPALAHSPDQLPFLKVNGQYTRTYPAGSTSLQNFVLPQDSAPATYLVGQPIHLALDTNNLPILPENLPQALFAWDLGDGMSGQGLSLDHVYQHMGSFVVTIHLSNKQDGNPPQLLDSILLNILPDPGYQLPQAVVSVNGRRPTNLYSDILKADFNQSVTLDGSASTGNIASYTWDLGDEQSSPDKLVRHTYSRQFSVVAPLLRVKDRNGFISDAFAQVENSNLDPSATPPASPSAASASAGRRSTTLPLVRACLVILLGVGAFLRRRKTRP